MNLWEDEEAPFPTTQKTYFRTWKGMPLRKDWNSIPFHQNMAQCIRCGYKWGQSDFIYQDGSFVNGELSPAMIHKTCWNCWMCDNNHAQVREYWDKIDGKDVAAKPPAKLERL